MRRKAYLSLLDSILSSKQIKSVQDGFSKGLPTGDNSFRRNLEKLYSVTFGHGKRGRPGMQKKKCIRPH
jgi:hypothetical protein